MVPTCSRLPACHLHLASSLHLAPRRFAHPPQWRDPASNHELTRMLRRDLDQSDTDTCHGFCSLLFISSARLGSGSFAIILKLCAPNKVCSKKNPVVVISSAGGRGMPHFVHTVVICKQRIPDKCYITLCTMAFFSPV